MMQGSEKLPAGFFRLTCEEGKWWFVSPAGELFFAIGTSRMGGPHSHGWHADSYHPDVKKAYADNAKWRECVSGRLRQWGFNYYSLAAGSEVRTPGVACSNACFSAMPYFRKNPKGRLHGEKVPGWQLFPDIFDPLWTETFEETCKQRAAPLKEEKDLLGHYTDNELYWGTGMYDGNSLFDAALEQTIDTGVKKELLSFFRKQYGDSFAALHKTWQTEATSWEGLEAPMKVRGDSPGLIADKRAFLLHYARHYFETTSRILKKHDPNHLNLGCRIHGWAEPGVIAAMKGNVDVVSYNKYDNDAPVYQIDDYFGALSGSPVILSEWGFRSMDSGLPNTGGVGRIVATQEERGKKYQHFLEGLARSKWCVGSNFYAYVDDPAQGGAGVMGNENSNYGLVDGHNQPYSQFVERVAEANRQVPIWRKQTKPDNGGIHICCPSDFVRVEKSVFVVERDGTVSDNRHVRAFLRGPDADDDCQSQTFILNFDRPSLFLLHIYETEGSAVLEVVLDQKVVQTVPMRAGARGGKINYNTSQGWHSVFDVSKAVSVPSGPHSITVSNIGEGWIWLNHYKITFPEP